MSSRGRWGPTDDVDLLDRPDVDGPRHPVEDRMGYSAALVVILVLAGLVGAGWWVAHREAAGRIPHGTTVAGVDIGGEDPTDALATLRRGLAGRAAAPITLVAPGRTILVDPADAGLAVDYAATVRRAVLSDSWSPTRLWDYFTDADVVAPIVDVDRTALRQEVTRLARQLARPTRDARVRFVGGRARVVRAQDGRGLDVDATSDALVAAYLSTNPAARVRTTSVAPPVTDQAVQAAMDRYVNPALSGPVTLRFAGRPVVLRPSAFAAVLTLTRAGDGLRLGVDPTRLRALVDPVPEQVRPPVDASVVLLDGRPVVRPGRRGLTFGSAAIAHAFLSLLGRSGTGRSATVPSVARSASFTSADARALRIERPVATVSLPLAPRQADHRTALVRQAARVDGTVLRPGGSFSLLQTAPPGDGSGSGDQETLLATTLYDAAFFAGLRDVDHTAPAAHLALLPLGREATVGARGPDLRFANDTPDGVLISVRVTARTVTASIWSRPTWDISTSTSCRTSPGSGAAEVGTTRVFRRAGTIAVDHVERLFTTYVGLPSATCRDAR